MTFEEFIGIRFADIDRETGRKMSHREIYARAIERFGGLEVVRTFVPFRTEYIREKAKEDPYLNNTDMNAWNRASGFVCWKSNVRPTGGGLWHLYHKHGITSASNSQGVSLLKEAALELCERSDSNV